MNNFFIKLIFFTVALGVFFVFFRLENSRRKVKARTLALKWINHNSLVANENFIMIIDAFQWPVRVEATVFDDANNQYIISLLVGGIWGGIFDETVFCEYKKNIGTVIDD